MHKLFLNSYNRLAGMFWVILIVLFWMQINELLPGIYAPIYILALAIPAILGAALLNNIFLPKLFRKKQMKRFAILFLVVTIVVSFCFNTISYGFLVLSELKYIPESIVYQPEDGFWNEMLSLFFIIFLINLAFVGLRLYYESTKLQENQLSTQLQVLQAQVNPHFMFNVLNHIHILIRKDVDLAEYLLEKYAQILRFQLYNSKQDYISIAQEVQFLKDVIAVEKLRWGNNIHVDACWEIEDSQTRIEPSLFIPFVENAFKYVSKTSIEPGIIDLYMQQNKKRVLFTIKNTKSKILETSSEASGIGLDNIKKRLSILYPSNHKLEILDGEEYFSVNLSLSLQKNERNTI